MTIEAGMTVQWAIALRELRPILFEWFLSILAYFLARYGNKASRRKNYYTFYGKCVQKHFEQVLFHAR